MNYVRNAWYVASWADDLPADKPVPVTLLDDLIVLYRRADGTPVALEDRCVHRLAPLSLGRCEGDNLRCMYHGMLFDETGKAIHIPGQDLIPKHARVRNYPVVERHSWIWVWMGNAEAADPALIPPAISLQDPDWILGNGVLDYDAEARLINDNLLDFSHLAFVHSGSFGVGEEWSDTPMAITPLERGVRFERWIPNSKPPAFVAGSDEPIDGFVTYDYLLPGILLMWSGNFAAGTGERIGFGRPDFAEAVGGVSWTSQAVTPLTTKTARYFFSAGPRHGFGDEQVRDIMVQVTKMAFAEDKEMIEAQQRVIDHTPNGRIMPTSHDRGSTIFNRMVDRLAKEEREVALVEMATA